MKFSSSAPAQINKCEKCGKTLRNKFNLKQHYERIHNAQTDPIKCPHCSKLSKNYLSLKLHIRVHHTDDNSRSLVPCPKCQKEVQKRWLKIHLKNHEEREGCVCEICGRIYKIKKHCVRHRRSAHSDYSANNFPCQTCGKDFVSSSNLKRHQETHSHLRRKVPCHLCSQFIYPDSYNEHVRGCFGQKGHRCYFCHKEFNKMCNLATHVRGSHTKEKPFYCRKCRYRTTQVGNLTRHENYKHSRNRRYTCYFCDFKSTHQVSLTYHLMAKHTKERPYKCEFCPKMYPTSDTLKGHMRRGGGPSKEDKIKHGL